MALSPGPSPASSPALTPIRFRSGWFWLAFNLPVRGSIRISTPTIASNRRAVKSAGASSTDLQLYDALLSEFSCRRLTLRRDLLLSFVRGLDLKQTKPTIRRNPRLDYFLF